MDGAGADLIRHPFWNIQQPTDVNADGRVTAFDAIAIINQLNTRGARSLASSGGSSGGEENQGPSAQGFIDVNNDNRLSAMDAITVINRLNLSAGEGEPMARFTVQIVEPGTNNDLTTVNKGGFYEVRILAEDLGITSYMGQTRPATHPTTGETLFGVITSFFDVQYDTTKTDFQVTEIQNLNITNGTTNGTFTLTVNDGGTLKTTGNIVFAGNRDIVTSNIQEALDTLLGENVVEVSRGAGTTNWQLRFINRLANRDMPEVTGTKNASLGASATITVTEVLKGLPGDPAAIADALRVHQFYDTDGNPLVVSDPDTGNVFYQDQRSGSPAPFGINDVGGSNFTAPYPGTIPTEIVRLRMTADDAGVVPINVSFADVLDDLETGVVGFSNPVTTDLILIQNDTITIVEALTAGDDTATTTEGGTAFIDINVLTNDVNNPPTPNTTKTIQSVNTTGTLGAVSIRPGNTVIRYTPPGGDFFGTDTFTYTVTDQAGNTDTATVTITISPINDAPGFGPTTPTSQTINEDTPRVFNTLNGNAIVLTDPDAAATLMTLTLNVGAGNGTLTLGSTNGVTITAGANGTNSITLQGTLSDLNAALEGLTYQPAQNLTGPVTLAVTINDNSTVAPINQSATRNIALTLTAVNDAPVVELGGFTASPTVVEGEPLVLNQANNTLIQISDVDAGTNPVVVTLNVAAGNTLNVNTTPGVTITPGTNGTNNVILTGTVAAINTALNGITYTSSATFGGNNESLQITVNDQGASGAVNNPLSDTETVTITVETSVRPRARTDSLTVAEDSVAGVANTVDVLLNDLVNPGVGVEAELQTFQATSVNGGTITRNDGGTPGDLTDDKLVYVPAPNFFGSDSFTYTMDDTSGLGVTATGTVNVTVTEVNDPVVAQDDTLTSVAEDSGARTIPAASLTGNDSAGTNEGSQTLTITAVSNPVGGTVTLVAGNPVFTPALNFNGTASFDYTVTDNGTTNGVAAPSSDTASVSFTVTEVNDAPTAGNQTLAPVAEDTPTVTIPFATLLAGATAGPANENGQALTISAVSAPVGGTVNIVGTDVVFTPTANFNGNASFTFTVQDNGTTNGVAAPLSVNANASFTITPANDAPVAVNDTATTGEAQQVDIPVRNNDFDVDVSPFTGTPGQLQPGTTIVNITTPTDGVNTVGTAVVQGTGIRFTPNAGFFGTATFTYQLNDGTATSSAATVTVTVVEANDPPVAVADPGNVTDEDTAVSIDVFGNDSDPDTAKANWSFVLVTPPANGDVVFTGGQALYTPDPDFNGTDSFVYRINDNSPINPQNQLSNTALVSITVREVNDAPVGGVDPASGQFTVIKDRDRTFTVAELLANDSPGLPANESGQSISITAVDTTSDQNGTVSLNGGVITYTPAPGFVGNDFFEYTLTDNGTTRGLADPESVQVRVNIIVRDFIPTTVNGFVYRDVNANGTYEVGTDFPLAGVDVTLSGTSEVTGAITPITIPTNHQGYYEFLDVEPGDYFITETQPLGLVDGAETLGLAASLAANDQIALDLPLLGLTGGVSTNNFGEGAINAGALVNSAGLTSELLASSTSNGFVLATTLAGDAFWSWALKNWNGAAAFDVVLDADKSAATLTVTDLFGVDHVTRIYQNPHDTRNTNRTNPDAAARLARFRILGWDAAGNHIIRIDGKASDFFGVGTPLAAAAAPVAAGEYVEGVDAAMAEENWA